MARPIVRAAEEGEKLWFYGGGVHSWKVTADDTDGSVVMFEDVLVRGKTTPLHHHTTDEIIYVLEGELVTYQDGVERKVGAGGTIMNPRGVPHALLVLSETARLLCIQTPGTAESFYRAASEPAGPSDGPVDFRRVGEAAKQTGVTVILGPPPFQRNETLG